MQIDILITARGLLDLALVFAEGRRVQNDQVKFLAARAQILENILLHKLVGGRSDSVLFEMSARDVERGFGGFDRHGFHGPAPGGINRKAAGVGEAIQHPPAARKRSDEAPVVPLIEKKSRLQKKGDRVRVEFPRFSGHLKCG